MERSPLTIVCAAPHAHGEAKRHPEPLMQHLSEHHKVLWIGPPQVAVGPPGAAFTVEAPMPQLHIGMLRYWYERPTFTKLRARAEWARGTDDEATLSFDGCDVAMLAWQTKHYVNGWRQGPLVLWLATPQAAAFIPHLKPDVVVYDVGTSERSLVASTQAYADGLLAQLDHTISEEQRALMRIRPWVSAVHVWPHDVTREHEHYNATARALEDLVSSAQPSALQARSVGDVVGGYL